MVEREVLGGQAAVNIVLPEKSHFLLSSNFCLDFEKEILISGLFGADIVRNLYF